MVAVHRKFRKCTEWPQTDFEIFTVKSTEYTLSTSEAQISSFLLYDQPFSRCRVVENRKCTEWPQNNLELLTVKSTFHALRTYPEAQMLGRFALRGIRLRDTRLSKSEIHRMAFYTSPHWLPRQTANKEQNMPKIHKNLKQITILLTTLVETLSKTIHEVWGVNLLCTFRGGVVLKRLLQYGPMLTKTTQSCQRSKIWNEFCQKPSLWVCIDFWEWICCVLFEEMSFDFFLPYGLPLSQC